MFKLDVSYDNKSHETHVNAYGDISRIELALILENVITSLARSVDLSFDDLFCKIYNLQKEA